MDMTGGAYLPVVPKPGRLAATQRASRRGRCFSPLEPLPSIRICVRGQGSETFKTLKKYCVGVKINKGAIAIHIDKAQKM